MVDMLVLGAPPPLHALGQGRDIALFLDLDGTLIDIAPSPDVICVPQDLNHRLERLAKLLGGRLALVSGRSLDNIALHLGELAIARAGSHGAERRLADGSAIGDVPEALPAEVGEAMGSFAVESPGLEYEPKAHGAALHYRAVPQLGPGVALFVESLAAEYGLELKHGKCVVELVRPGSGKAGAVRAFMQESGFASALPVFVGDDITDEDGFRAASELGGFGVIVGDRMPTAARYCLENPAKVIEWLTL